MDTDGDFVVTWSSYGQSGNGNGYDIYARRYDLYGAGVGPRVPGERDRRRQPGVFQRRHGHDGGFVVVWQSNQDGVANNIYYRMYDANGDVQFQHEGPLTGEYEVNTGAQGDVTPSNGDQEFPDVAMDLAGDKFVVTWSSFGEDGSGWGVYSREFARPNLPHESDTVIETNSDRLFIPDPIYSTNGDLANDFVSKPITITENTISIDSLRVHLDVKRPTLAL